ncbi:hypothetical protein C9374_005466 [Naegleria lovaniensis]|uniref:Uncharacterized protein n=1 Tax=Naegleria lovaniensis TaxID=51637 RepID=A0AA88KHX9_NAELO|nr:uncharacterized protein C9374_005466 [Naegleria lovaniensis]KAG2382264.1 hypothetical protein C9374_005466 [Naegleria lovaniensis]
MTLKSSHIIILSTVTLFLLFSNTFVYTALNNGISIAGSDSLNDVQLYPPNTNTSSKAAYATKADIEVLSYYLSVLQVVVIINSVLIGLLLLIAFTLTAIRCMEDYKPDYDHVQDPLWLKGFSITNSIVSLLLCQCFAFARPKGKRITVFNEDQWRKWHKRDLDLQRGIIEEEYVEDEKAQHK